jgi:hypothetical protein
MEFLLTAAQSLDAEVPRDPRSRQRLTIMETSNTKKINKTVYQTVPKV